MNPWITLKMAKPISMESRYSGALLGLAVGDALGTTLEFSTPGTFDPITDMVGGGPFNLKPGEWTDDTSMALCLAESILETGGFDPVDQMQRYVRWRDEGHLSATGECFDIGVATSRALDAFKQWGEPYAGSIDPQTAGNGSLVRLAPIPMRWRTDLTETAHYAALNSRTTHAAQEAVDACRYYAVLIASALEGVGKTDLLAPNPAFLDIFNDDPICPAVAAIAEGGYRDATPPAIRGSGYVVHTLEAALWALVTTDDFRSGLLKVVNLGEDADTTGAVYGQLAGAVYGKEAIPVEWSKNLSMQDQIESYASSLHKCSQ
ncbi:ADP-ribosylglycohydrolase family protein [Marinobacter salarius]|uniref:ADP-ribosylglycohydrolase family protein n=1 Tax=Marinobacter salarius TaxID=1420917 RepID=UPI003BA85B33